MDVNHETRLPCVDCGYFQAQDKSVGTCHRFPPTFAGDSAPKETHHWKFPLVTPHQWCGEFQTKLSFRDPRSN